MDLLTVCRFLSACAARGESCVMVTVCAVEGSLMREPGTIMGVAADGSFAGSLSGGCIENAVVAEALDALRAGATRIVRFGAGSPYLDIRLPCGGGLDLHFCPIDAEERFASHCLAALADRTPFSVEVGDQGVDFARGWQPTRFDSGAGEGVFGHFPAPLVQIIGHGAGVEALARLALTLGCEMRVLTPDDRIIAALADRGITARRLDRRTRTDLLTSDAWTAFAFLFHDHDWEGDLVLRALELPHFYLGAMGGRIAHRARCEALVARGASAAAIASIRAPIGLFHSSRDPHTLALSTLAEVIRTYHETDFAAHNERALG
jgi:xanthine dehydrogenase accessory factor